MYENGSSISSISGHTTYADGDEFRIEYSGGNVRYYHNGVLCRTVARTIGSPLYADCSFYNSGSIRDVEFGPIPYYVLNSNYATISGSCSGNAATATNAPWTGITGKPTTFTPSAHTHTASDITGLPTKLSAFTNDVGYITGITKSMVEGVLTGNIGSHYHLQYLTSALIPAKLPTQDAMIPPGYLIIKINNNNSKWILSFDVKIVFPDGNYTIRFSEDNSTKSKSWYSPSASMIDGENSIEVKFGYSQTNKWIAIEAIDAYAGITITNVANGRASIDTYALDKLFAIEFFEDWAIVEGGDSALGYLGTVQKTITIYPPSKEGHTHTFASLTSKPTTISGYGITDAYTASTIDSKLSGYLPLSGGTMTGTIIVGSYTAFGQTGGNFYLGTPNYPLLLRSNGTTTINGNTLIHSGNYNSYAPKLDGTGASGTWGISISGNAATATKLATARTIWGQSFDGTGNVSGGMEGVHYIEMSNSTPYIDFHYGFSTADYTSRIIEGLSGQLTVTGKLRVGLSYNTSTDYAFYVNGDGYFVDNVITEGDFSSRGDAIIDGHAKVNSLKASNICIECDNSGNSAGHTSEINNYSRPLYIQYSTSNNCCICYGGGNVGIGITSPTYKLHVYGDARIDGTISCIKLSQTSDIKYKTNIKQIEYEEALKIIENLNPVTWD